MIISLKNKHTLQVDQFNFKCCIGKKGLTSKKKEGDNKTPTGTYGLGHLYYRKDRIEIPQNKLRCIKIRPKMGWCDDTSSKAKYNKLVDVDDNVHHEKIYRKDYKYDLLIPIKYNFNSKMVLGKGSCIFIHLTKDYKPTAGCIALKQKDFLILLKIINKYTKIKI